MSLLSVRTPKMMRSSSAPPKTLTEVLQSAETSVESALENFTNSLNTVLEEEDIPSPPMMRSLTDGCSVEITFLAELDELLAKLSLKHESKASTEKETKVAAPLCSICFEEFKAEADVARICLQEDCDKTFCKACLTAYVKSAITSGYGTCPVVKCPACSRFTSFSQWKVYAEDADKNKYLDNAKQVLTLQCGNCHQRGTLLTQSKHADERARLGDYETVMNKITQRLGEERGNKIAKAFGTYCQAQMSPIELMQILVPTCAITTADVERKLQQLQAVLDEAHQKVKDYDETVKKKSEAVLEELRQLEVEIQQGEEKLGTITDDIASMRLANQIAGLKDEMRSLLTKVRKSQLNQEIEKGAFVHQLGLAKMQKEIDSTRSESTEAFLKEIMPELLEVTPDQERRSSLHLRYCILYPFVSSLCCKAAHCFKCKTKGVHEGKTCEENQAALPTEIRGCPQCNTPLVKGDGCNSIRCVCGHSFTWTAATKVA